MACRINPAAKPHPHACSQWHRALVDNYHAAVAAQAGRAEHWSIGYATELAEFYQTQERRLTLKAWLIAHTTPPQEGTT